MKKKTNKHELVAKPHLLCFFCMKKGKDLP